LTFEKNLAVFCLKKANHVRAALESSNLFEFFGVVKPAAEGVRKAARVLTSFQQNSQRFRIKRFARAKLSMSALTLSQASAPEICAAKNSPVRLQERDAKLSRAADGGDRNRFFRDSTELGVNRRAERDGRPRLTSFTPLPPLFGLFAKSPRENLVDEL